MEEIRYIISQASKRVEVEAHVLRNWEDELGLPIPRNQLRHRYYRDSDIELLKAVKKLKDNGLQLKAIKMLLPNLTQLDNMDVESMIKLKDELNGKVIEMYNDEKEPEKVDGTSIITSDEKHEMKEQPNDKMGQFKAIMSHIILSALKENNTVLTDEISVNVTDGVIKEMNYLMRLQEEKEEERYKKFDSTLREYQKSRSMAAVAFDGKARKKSKFLKKNKLYI